MGLLSNLRVYQPIGLDSSFQILSQKFISLHLQLRENRAMALFDRVSRLIRANVNDLVSKAEDPEKILEQALLDMQESFVELKQAVAGAIANQKRSQMQYDNNIKETETWQQRAQLALQKGDEGLAKEALIRKKSFSDTATALKSQLDLQVGQVDTMKKSLMMLEGKIVEAKNKKGMLQARAQAAKANEQLTSSLNSMNTNSAMGAFERMEDKVLQMEARGQAAAELAGSNLEAQFASLESADVDLELAAMKQQLLGGAAAAQPQIAATGTAAPGTPPPPLDATAAATKAAEENAVADELEALKKQLDQL
jgi:phage shock protein A